MPRDIMDMDDFVLRLGVCGAISGQLVLILNTLRCAGKACLNLTMCGYEGLFGTLLRCVVIIEML